MSSDVWLHVQENVAKITKVRKWNNFWELYWMALFWIEFIKNIIFSYYVKTSGLIRTEVLTRGFTEGASAYLTKENHCGELSLESVSTSSHVDSACSGSATSSLLNKDSVQQKVRADSLPHVVCLKCDPNEVTGFLGKSLDTSERLNHISSVKTNLQCTVCAFIVIFNTTQPSCIFKVLTQDQVGTLLRASCVFVEHGVI